MSGLLMIGLKPGPTLEPEQKKKGLGVFSIIIIIRARTVKPGPRHLRTRPDPGQNRLGVVFYYRIITYIIMQ